jgi:hypothetical protein
MPQDPNELLFELYGQEDENYIPGPEDTPAVPGVVMPTASQPGQPQVTGQNWTNPEFTPTMPAPNLLSLEEMIDIVNRRTDLATQPRLDALDRSRETLAYEGQKRVGEVQAAYDRARGDITKDVNLAQQKTSQTAASRGIYDSGLAMHLSNQIARKGLELGMQLGEEQARQLADIAEFLHLQTKHNLDEIQSIMGEKSLMAATMLDEMRLEQQQRGDTLAQQEFENWLSHQAFQLNEYWREQEFEATQSEREWQRWFNEEQMRIQQEQMEWERIFGMNRWEAEFELQRMLANHQISQQEFQNAMAKDEFNLKVSMFNYEKRNSQKSYGLGSYPAVNQPST